MAIFREPSGWVAAALMDSSFTGSYIFVEGCSDERFWKKYLDNQNIKICVCNGWECVVEVIKLLNIKNFERCIGVIDRDFRSIQGEDDCNEENLYYTDYHDIEIMMFESEALKSILIAIDRDNKIGSLCNYDYPVILKKLYAITDQIGYLKLANINNHLQLMFKKQINHELRKPKYEDIVDKCGNYLGTTVLINKVCGFTSSYSAIGINRDSVLNAFQKECVNCFDSKQLSNGHDVLYVLSFYVSRAFGIKEKYSQESLESLLYSSYHITDFCKTQLFKVLLDWEKKHNKSIFLKTQIDLVQPAILGQ